MSETVESFAVRVLAQAHADLLAVDLALARETATSLEAAADIRCMRMEGSLAEAEEEALRLRDRLSRISAIGAAMAAQEGSVTMKVLQAVLAGVEIETGISREILKGSSRKQEPARARMLAMWLIRKLTPLSLPQIGRHFGGRHHTTVMHAIREIDGLEGAEEEARDRLRRVLVQAVGSMSPQAAAE